MGSHAKTRTTGRKTALGALAVGATLTGVGLTAAALDPATAVLTAGSVPGGSAAIQLSGLATPVALSADSTSTDPASLAAAPLTAAAPSTGAAVHTAKSAISAAETVGHGAPTAQAVPAASAPQSTQPTQAPQPAQTTQPAQSGQNASSSGLDAIRPIQQGLSALTDGYAGKHRQTRSATPSAATSAVGSLAAPVTGEVAGLLGSVPVVGQLLGGSGDGQSDLAVPGLSSLTPLGSLTSALPLGL